MGHFLSWLQPLRNNQALQDVSVEQQSQPKQTSCTPKAEAASSRPSILESMSASTSSASKGESAKSASATGATETLSSVAAGGAAKTAVSKGKTEEIQPKEMSKNVSSSSSKDRLAKVEPAASVLASTAATKEKSKQKTLTEAPKESKKVESKKPAMDIPPSPLAPPADKKAKDNSMSPDALSALGDLLPAEGPVSEPPKIQPQDIVQEDKQKSEKGVRVGEREDTLPPEYRSTEDKMKDYPPPQKEPSLDSGEALDILSGDFSCPAVAPAATEPSKQSSPDVAVVDALAGDFVAPKKASSVQAPMIPPAQTQQKSMSASTSSASKGESAKSASATGATETLSSVAAGGAAKTAVSKGKTEEIQPKEMSKNVSSSSSKDRLAKVEPAASVLASTAATKEKSKQKTLTEAPKESKKVESKKPAMDIPPSPLAPPADKKAKDNSMSPDALSALGDLLPAEGPVSEPPKIQPQDIVQEDKQKSEKGVRVGEREDTLPPEYRSTEDKMKDYPPPQKEPSLDSGEALDILSGDFSCPAVAPAATEPSKQSSPDVAVVDALAGDFVAPKKASSVQAPMIPPAQTQQKSMSASTSSASKGESAKSASATGATETLSSVAAGGAAKTAVSKGKTEEIQPKEMSKNVSSSSSKDRLAKVEPAASVLASTAATKEKSKQKTLTEAPKESKKVESKKPAMDIPPSPLAPPADKKAKDNSMSPDALSALGDLLPAEGPVSEPPKIQPQDIVQEDKQKSEKGVRVGEREDTLPPEYRSTEDKMKDYPPPQKEPSLDSGEALDILSGDFSCPAVAPAATEPSKQSSPDVAVVDALAGDFVAPKKASSVQAPMIPPAQTQQKDNSMSPDALSALGDLLPAAEPVPQPPKIQSQDIVQEDKLKSEKGVRVGEREDTLPPEYRSTEDKMKDYPPPQKEPSMDSGEALDILSGDFSCPAVAPPATVPATTSKQSNSDVAAVDALAGDFVAPKKASSVQPPMIPCSQTQQQVADRKLKSKSKKQTEGDRSMTDKRTEHSGTDVATKTPTKKSTKR